MTMKNFVQIPNVAFGFSTDYKLNDDELRVFAYLQFMKNVGTMNIRTHATIIVEDLGWTTSKASRDNARVATALEGLRDKGYITLSFKNDARKDALAIEINDEMKSIVAEGKVDWKERPFKFSGYTEIKVNEYNLAGEDDYHLTVMAYHKWRANAEFEYAICDKEWAEVMGLKTVKQARAIIHDCTFLTKISGEKYQDDNGQWKQEPNQYVKTESVKTDLKEVETNNRNMSFLDKERQKVTDLYITADDEVFEQIFDKKKYFKFKGYKAWAETDCKYAKQAGQKKLDAIAKAPKGDYVIKKLEEEYQEHLDHEERQARQEAMLEKKMAEMDFETPEEYEERMKKQDEIRKEKKKKDSWAWNFFDDDM